MNIQYARINIQKLTVSGCEFSLQIFSPVDGICCYIILYYPVLTMEWTDEKVLALIEPMREKPVIHLISHSVPDEFRVV